MKRILALLLSLCIAWLMMLSIVSCSRQTVEEDTTGPEMEMQETAETQEIKPGTETGYPTGELGQPQLMYNGKLYFYLATGFDDPLPDGYEYAGSIAVEDNVNVPTEDFHGARVEVGQKIFASADEPDTVYVEYETGFARFSVR